MKIVSKLAKYLILIIAVITLLLYLWKTEDNSYELPFTISENRVESYRKKGMKEPIDFLSKNINTKYEHFNFDIYKGKQSWTYLYDVWFKSDQKGNLYLKAFEIETDAPLTLDSLKWKSTIAVDIFGDEITKYSLKSTFSIYEGDSWEKYWGKFEVWFISNENWKEKKLGEKNYIIEWWER